MYTHHFHLTDLPFSISPNPRFLYLSPRHHEALAHLLYGVAEGGGFVALTGEVGTGKTTLCNTLLEQLPESVDVALILNPRLDAIELMQALCDELKILFPAETRSLKVLGDALNRYLLDAHARGRRTVVLIDEAQNLSFDVLEQVRLLTNLETHTVKLLQILLVGQPELIGILNRNELRQLNQRITARYHLMPLSAVECNAYIQHRLRVCGGDPELFTASALRRIWKFAKGVPRLINVICDRALLGAFAEGRKRVTARIVRKAARELSSPVRKPARRSAAHLLAAVLAGVTLMSVAYYWTPIKDSVRTQAAVTSKSPALAGTEQSPPAPSAVNRKRTDLPVQVKTIQDSVGDGETPRSTADDEVQSGSLVSTPPAEASPPSLGKEFGALIREEGYDLATGFERLFRRWDIPADDRDMLSCEGARLRGLECLAQRGNWNQLLTFNHPVILEFSFPSGSKHYALLTRLEGKNPVLDLQGESQVIPIGDMLQYWHGYYVLFWHPPAPGLTVLLWGNHEQVTWLQNEIASDPLMNLSVEPTGLYDERLRSAVAEFQRRKGLTPDGVAGPHTLITLAASQPDETGSPRLKEED